MSTALKNVPTTFDSLNDPTLNADQHFSTFLKIFQNPGSTYKPITTLGTTDADLFAAFVDKYLAGNVAEPAGGPAGRGGTGRQAEPAGMTVNGGSSSR